MNFEDKITRKSISSRGGGIEIDLTEFGFDGKMSAYQNYLGGGMLGKVCVNDSLRQPGKPWLTPEDNQRLDEIGEQLKRYFFELTNPDDEWEGVTFEQNQKLPVSAY